MADSTIQFQSNREIFESYNEAKSFLSEVAHKPGQPICVIYDDYGLLNILFAIGLIDGTGGENIGYKIINTDQMFVYWRDIVNGTITIGDQFVPAEASVGNAAEMPSNFIVLAHNDGSSERLIMKDGEIYGTNTLNNMLMDEVDIVIGSDTYHLPAGNFGTLLQFIFNTISNQEVTWQQISNAVLEEGREDIIGMFDGSSFLQKDQNLKDVNSRQDAINNLTNSKSNTYRPGFVFTIDSNGNAVFQNSNMYWVGTDSPVKFRQMGQAQYNNLASKDPGTIYITTDTRNAYLGNKALYDALAFNGIAGSYIDEDSQLHLTFSTHGSNGVPSTYTATIDLSGISSGGVASSDLAATQDDLDYILGNES